MAVKAAEELNSDEDLMQDQQVASREVKPSIIIHDTLLAALGRSILNSSIKPNRATGASSFKTEPDRGGQERL